MNCGDVLLVADFIEHLEDRFVGAAVERPVQRGDPGRHRRKRVDPGGADGANRAGGAVLFVVGVQDQQDFEGFLQHRVGLVLAPDAERHVDEVADVVQVVAGEDVRQAAGMAEEERGDGRHLGEQANLLHPAVDRVLNVLGVGVEGRQRADGAEEHAHGVRVVAESLEKLGDVGVDVGVVLDVVLPLRQLVAVGSSPFIRR